MKKVIIIFLFFSSYLQSQELEYVTLNYSVEYNERNKYLVSKIAIELEKFINNPTTEFWVNDSLSIKADGEFIKNLSLGSSITFQPTILAITPLENTKLEYTVKVGFFNNKEKRFYMNSVFNIIAKFSEDKSEVKFKSVFKHNFDKLCSKKIQEVSFYYNKKFHFDDFDASLFVDYNKRLAKFFELKPISFKYIICENFDDCMALLGYDFEQNMFNGNKIGAITYPRSKFILSGNNKTSNNHELVHLYTYLKNPNRNSILDEGLAVFFGGSKGYDLRYHIKALKEHLDENDIDIFQQLFFGNYVIDENTSLKYTMGGLITKILLKKGGKELFFEVFEYSDTNDALIEKLLKVLDVNKSELNQYFINYIQKF